MNQLEAHLQELEEILKHATPLPWEMGANVPFYVDMRKPAPSLSKHDERRPTYWRYEDGVYALAAIHALPKLLAAIKVLNDAIKGMNNLPIQASDEIYYIGEIAMIEAGRILEKP